MNAPETAASVTQAITMPTIADGEHYAGIILDEAGAPLHHLILLPGGNNAATWDAAKEFATTAGGELPTRQEQSLLFANCKQHFERDWYWSGEQHAADSGYAWSQNFRSGYQNDCHKDNELRARAVRRVAI